MSAYEAPQRLPISSEIANARRASSIAFACSPRINRIRLEAVRFSPSIGTFPSSSQMPRASDSRSQAVGKSPRLMSAREMSWSVNATCSRASSSRAIASDASPASTARSSSPFP